MREGDAQRAVCGEVEFGITLAPVPGVGLSVSVAAVRQRGRDWYGEDRLDDGNVDGRRGARAVDFVRHVGLAIIEAGLAGEEGEKREAEITWSGQ